MGGVTVSAKAAGSSITTTVYTDEAGNYYFPPLPSGSYRVWAQALTYATAKGSVELTGAGHQDFVLDPMKDWVRQLPGDELLAALPGDTPDDARMKTLVRKNCTGCHTASYPLQHRFDAAGWSAVLDLMKHVNVLGTYQGPEHKPNPTIESHKAELAAYLARARGPGESSMKFNLRPRPSGEAARVVFKEYDVPPGAQHQLGRRFPRASPPMTAATGRSEPPRAPTAATGCMTRRPISTAISGSLTASRAAPPRSAGSTPRPAR